MAKMLIYSKLKQDKAKVQKKNLEAYGYTVEIREGKDGLWDVYGELKQDGKV